MLITFGIIKEKQRFYIKTKKSNKLNIGFIIVFK